MHLVCSFALGDARIKGVAIDAMFEADVEFGVGFGVRGFFNWLDVLATLVMFASVTLQLVADRQLHAFIATRQEGEQLHSGLWAWSRHPNYFGELGFWTGLYLFGLAAHPAGWWWMATGVLLMTAMFLFASIPMMEKRSLERRPNYQRVIDTTSMLVPLPPRQAG